MGLQDAGSRQVSRVIDANLNRLSEGLRVLEDIARMILDDKTITQQLKTLRHDLIRADISGNIRLVDSRDSTEDVGIDLEVAGDPKEKDLPTILVANSRRAQESLRVLEEMSKIPALNLDPNLYKQARFSLYTIERSLLGRLLRQDKMTEMTGLYVIIDTASLKNNNHIDVTRQVIKGGAKTIQLRDKTTSKRELLSIARQMRDMCAENNVLFIINDHLDIAVAVKADGLHIGQDDLPIAVARRQVPIDMIIGGSVVTLEQAIEVEKDGADYIGFGAVYPTATKDIIVPGLSVLNQVNKSVKIPIVAIGGINKNNIKEVMAAGADAAAVISAVLHAEDPEAATRELAGLIEKWKN